MQFKTIVVNVHFIFFSTKAKIFKISNLVQDVRFQYSNGDFFFYNCQINEYANDKIDVRLKMKTSTQQKRQNNTSQK